MVMDSPHLLAFSGSEREGSVNRALLDVAVNEAIAQGAIVEYIDLRALELPLYDADLEERAFPAAAAELRDALAGHDGFIIASPEYNGSIAPLLKNAIDWASRPAPTTLGDPFARKAAILLSASPSPFGGIRSLIHLRAVLSKLGTIAVPQEIAVPHALNARDVAELAPRELLGEACRALFHHHRAARQVQPELADAA